MKFISCQALTSFYFRAMISLYEFGTLPSESQGAAKFPQSTRTQGPYPRRKTDDERPPGGGT